MPGGLSEEQERQRTRVFVNPGEPSFTRSDVSATSFDAVGFDNSFDPKRFAEDCRIDVISCSDEEIVFDLVGVDAAVANALRRILLAEVPTVAIETVLVHDNTSVIQDEVLAHRLGLVPLRVDPRLLSFRDPEDKSAPRTGTDTVTFELEVACEARPGVPHDAPATERFVNAEVLSGQLRHVPVPRAAGGDAEDADGAGLGGGGGDGGGEQQLPEALRSVAPVEDDILLAKLRPGQRIHVVCHAEKGVGRVHAKWSPVATASYRLLPEIEVVEGHFEGKNGEAEELVKACPAGVFDIEDLGGSRKKAVPARPRDCTMCRECIRPEGWSDKVKLRRVRDHFIFSIESTGALPAADLFREAIRVFKEKIATVRDLIDAREVKDEDDE